MLFATLSTLISYTSQHAYFSPDSTRNQTVIINMLQPIKIAVLSCTAEEQKNKSRINF